MADYPDALPVGTILGKDFRILRVLGQGGFGITYEAFDGSLRRIVAIKEFFPFEDAMRLSNGHVAPKTPEKTANLYEYLARFVTEGQILSLLPHPNIVSVFHTLRDVNSTAYIVLEYVEGSTFEDWLKQLGRPPTQLELDLLLDQLLDALDTVHHNKIQHRDIKPQNIFIRSRTQIPVLLDFGSARQERSSDKQEPTKAFVSPGYTPFEVLLFNPALLGPWVDIYGLAACVYRAVSQEAPLDAVKRKHDDQLEHLARTRHALSYRREFLQAVMDGLKMNHEERPQNIRDWRTALFAGSDMAVPITERIPRSRQEKTPPNLEPALLPQQPTAPDAPPPQSPPLPLAASVPAAAPAEAATRVAQSPPFVDSAQRPPPYSAGGLTPRLPNEAPALETSRSRSKQPPDAARGKSYGAVLVGIAAAIVAVLGGLAALTLTNGDLTRVGEAMRQIFERDPKAVAQAEAQRRAEETRRRDEQKAAADAKAADEARRLAGLAAAEAAEARRREAEKQIAEQKRIVELQKDADEKAKQAAASKAAEDRRLAEEALELAQKERVEEERRRKEAEAKRVADEAKAHRLNELASARDTQGWMLGPTTRAQGSRTLVSVAPDGRQIAIASTGEVSLWGTADGKRKGGAKFDNAASIALAPESVGRIALVRRDGQLEVRSADLEKSLGGGKLADGLLRAQVFYSAVPSSGFIVIYWTSSEQRDGSSSDRTLIERWSLDGKRLSGPASIREGGLDAAAISPLGDRVAVAIAEAAPATSGGPPHRSRIIVWEIRGERIVDVGVTPAPVRALAFGSDGQTVVAGGQFADLRVWRIGSGEPPRLVPIPLTGANHYVTTVAVSRDGPFMVYGTNRNEIGVLNRDTGRPEFPHLRSGPFKEVEWLSFLPRNHGRLWLATSGATGIVRLLAVGACALEDEKCNMEIKSAG